MKLKNEKEALQMFCDKEDGLRPLMTKPFKNERDEGRVWATDGHVLLIVDPKLTRCKYETGRLGLPTFNDDNCDMDFSKFLAVSMLLLMAAVAEPTAAVMLAKPAAAPTRLPLSCFNTPPIDKLSFLNWSSCRRAFAILAS